jgi:predicted transcriptional regulator
MTSRFVPLCAAIAAGCSVPQASLTDASIDASIGGTVRGLVGQGLVLVDQAGDTASIGADGPFAFATTVSTGMAYSVTVQAQPTAPSQTCSIANSSGIVNATDVGNIAVTCATSAFQVGGTVVGLAGVGLVLQVDNGDDLAINADGMFAFAHPIASGTSYKVTVKTQPTSPAQTCTIVGAAGTVVDASVDSIAVTCQTDVFIVGGTVSGLAGAGLVLQNNGGDDLAIAGNGSFTFATLVASGRPYAVTVRAQPGNPSQSCTVAGGTGTIVGAAAVNVTVTCTTRTFAVGGTVTGLVGGGLVLRDNGGDDLAITGNGSFAFATPVGSGAAYAVTVATNPSSPSQTCSVANGSGTVGSGAVAGVVVTCATNVYAIGGTVTGLVGTGLVLRDNGGDDLPIASNGAFAFATPVASGATYAVTVSAQPHAPSQTCTVAMDRGTVASSNVVSVSIRCATDAFAIGGTVTGLQGNGLVLRDNGGDSLAISGNGTFAFASPVASGQTYAVAVGVQPNSPSQTCTVTNGSSTVGASAVTDVLVTCATNKYAIGGTVTGLAGTGLVLRDNGGDDLTITANGSFAFATPIASGASYAATVSSQPFGPSQTCTVSSGSGSAGASNVTSIAVSCTTNSFSIGGVVTGLQGSGLVLRDNGGDNLAIAGNGAFTFATPIASGQTYAATVLVQPGSPTQTCTVSAGAGTVGASNVTGIVVSCAVNVYTIGGTVNGLVGSGLVLQDNGGNSLAVATAGSFAFSTPIASGGAYAVTVLTQPTSPSQTCAVTAGGSGTVASTNVTSIVVTCTTNTYAVAVNVGGLAGSGLILQDNGGDNLMIAGNGTTAFATRVASGATYAVSVATNPSSPSQACTVSNGSGTIGSSAVTVAVACTTNAYAIGGSVNGLVGSGLVLQDNSGNNLPVPSAGAFAFTTPIASGQTYAVTVLTQPTSPSQTCVVAGGSGTVGAANVTSVVVNCTTNAYAIRGIVQMPSGVLGTGLVLVDNSSDNVTVTAAGAFAFPTKIASGQTYSVAVLAQPTSPSQTCTVSGGSGTVGGGDVTNVVVTCTTNTYTISGRVSGLAGGALALLDNGGDSLVVNANGTFTFATAVASGQSYLVSVGAQPSGPTQTCAVSAGSGTVAGANITNVAIACTTNSYTVGGTISGLVAGTTVTLQNTANGTTTESLVVGASGNFTFPTAVPSGQTYAVVVTVQPINPYQQCSVTTMAGGSGTITNANITTVAISCSLNSYFIGGTITGLSGSGLSIQNNGGDTLVLAAMTTTFTFPTRIQSGKPYAVTVSAQPNNPGQTCTVSLGTGTVTNGNMANIVIACTTNTYQLTLQTSAVAGTNATGKLTVSPTGTSCGANCYTYSWGQTVTVSATGDAGFYLSTWGGDCPAGNSSLTCSLSMTASHVASAQFAPPNFAFVTSTTQYPNTSSPITSIDAACQATAQAANLPGHYVGWAGWGYQSSFATRVGSAAGWVRVDGKPFAVSLLALMPDGSYPAFGHSLYPLAADEHGITVPNGTPVLSGQNFPALGINADCSGFTIVSNTQSFTNALANDGWTGIGGGAEGSSEQCGTAVRYYCFGTDYSVNMSTYPRATGRFAFALNLASLPTTGVAGLDGACASAATANGLPGTYSALVATTTATPASRFSTTGLPWVRTDGIPIVTSSANLFAAAGPIMVAPLDVDAKAGAVTWDSGGNNSSGVETIIGAASFNSVASSTSNCSNFTSTTGNANIGDAARSDSGAATFGSYPCNIGNVNLYCLQQ